MCTELQTSFKCDFFSSSVEFPQMAKQQVRMAKMMNPKKNTIMSRPNRGCLLQKH